MNKIEKVKELMRKAEAGRKNCLVIDAGGELGELDQGFGFYARTAEAIRANLHAVKTTMPQDPPWVIIVNGYHKMIEMGVGHGIVDEIYFENAKRGFEVVWLDAPKVPKDNKMRQEFVKAGLLKK